MWHPHAANHIDRVRFFVNRKQKKVEAVRVNWIFDCRHEHMTLKEKVKYRRTGRICIYQMRNIGKQIWEGKKKKRREEKCEYTIISWCFVYILIIEQ